MMHNVHIFNARKKKTIYNNSDKDKIAEEPFGTNTITLQT